MGEKSGYYNSKYLNLMKMPNMSFSGVRWIFIGRTNIKKNSNNALWYQMAQEGSS